MTEPYDRFTPVAPECCCTNAVTQGCALPVLLGGRTSNPAGGHCLVHVVMVMKKTTSSMVIVVGASAGGMEALKTLVAQFSKDSQVHIDRIRAMLKATDKDASVSK